MSTEQKPRKPRPSRGSRQFGYGVSIVVQIVILIFVNNVAFWDWSFLSWLTDEFADLLPYINLSIVASIIVNAICIAYDPPWFRSFTQAILGAISLFVAIQTWRIFPFDFSQTAFDWTTMVRIMLIFVMFAIGAGIIGEIVKTVRALSSTESIGPPAAPAT